MMSSRHLRLTLACQTLIAWTSVACLGQARKPEAPGVSPASVRTLLGFLGPVFLLDDEEIRKELKLKAEQVEKINQLKKVESQRLRDFTARRKAQRGSKDANDLTRINPFEFLKELQLETERSVQEVLTPAQSRRLEQIVVQSRGLIGLVSDPETAEQLLIDDFQRPKIAEILEELRKTGDQIEAERREMVLADVATTSPLPPKEGLPPDPAEAKEKSEANRLEAQKKSDATEKRSREINARATAVEEKANRLEAQKKSDATEKRSREINARATAMEEKANRAIRKLLTVEQRQLITKRCGPPFDFNRLTLRKRAPKAAPRDQPAKEPSGSDPSTARPTPPSASTDAGSR